jgi:hypothetical protein
MTTNNLRTILGALALVTLAGASALFGAEPVPAESSVKRIYIIHFSHTDVGFTDMPGVCRELQCRYLDIALDGVLATMSGPAERKFYWTCESLLTVDDWWQASSPERREEFLKAVLPYFCGARGVVLWGSEPKRKGQYYQTLPVFMNSLGRVADLSAKIAAAKLMPDEPAHILWKAKRPLIRRLRVTADEWIILAVNPWQAEDATSTVEVPVEKGSLTVELRGKHTELFHVVGTNLQRLSVAN